MLEFGWWWMFALAPLGLLPLILRPVSSTDTALYVPFRQEHSNASLPATGASWQVRCCWAITWLLLVTAAARPHLTNEEVIDTRYVRNIVLAIDISKSMLEKDMQVGTFIASRLGALKHVLDEFIQNREGDQLGLVIFADSAFVRSPLSYDTQAIASQVQDLVVGLAGERTAIGDALVLSVKVIVNNPLADSTNASVILLSDGKNNWGKVNPVDAMQLAQEHDIRVYTIGFGSNRFSSAMDEQALVQIANQTGGAFYRATNTAELRQVYAHIDSLNRVEIDTSVLQQRKEIYHWPLLAALGMAAITLLFLFMYRHHVYTKKTTKKTNQRVYPY